MIVLKIIFNVIVGLTALPFYLSGLLIGFARRGFEKGLKGLDF